jgi:colanic acid/amylovoran biosynthesis glycosyltransferase
MKILYITGSMPYGTGEAFLIAEVRELIRLGHEVVIIPRSPGRRAVHGRDLLTFTRREGLLSWRVIAIALRQCLAAPAKAAAAVRPIWRSGRWNVMLKNLAVIPKAFWLAEFARRIGADHIHCHWAGTTATMALVASRLTNIPWSLTAHRSDIVGNNLLETKARSAAFVRFISEDGRAMARALGMTCGATVRTLHMGVAIPVSANGKRPGSHVVLCPADLLPIKGHEYLIQAWARLRTRGFRGELWLAGEGPLARRLQRLVRSLNIGDSVKFLGRLEHEALLQFYAAGLVSVVALPSIDLGDGSHEGIPVALMEAMSFGIPVIATNTGGIPELVIEGTGLLVPPADPSALADAIETALGDEARWEQLGRCGRSRVIDAFGVARIAAELAGWLETAGREAIRSMCEAAIQDA